MKRWIDLPTDFRAVVSAYIGGLTAIFGDKLFGAYLYGAAVFEDSGPAQDIDCHVIIVAPPTELERSAAIAWHTELARTHPPLGAELDSYTILLSAAGQSEPPQHQLWPDVYDCAWALHCAHVRASRFLTLYGPEPDSIFPAPSWASVEQALENELDFVRTHLRYPAYCVLNLCRIIYSFQTRDVVVSKRFSGRWAKIQFPQWRTLISAAEGLYDGLDGEETAALLEGETVTRFLAFAEDQIAAASQPAQ